MENDKMATTIIAEDVEITGSIKCASNLEINGKLNGDLSCTAAVVVGKSAQIKGNINVDGVTVHGQVNGNVMAKDRIELKSTARLTGDIKAKRLTVEDGVSFVGKAEVNPSGETMNRSSDHPPRPPEGQPNSGQPKGPDAGKK